MLLSRQLLLSITLLFGYSSTACSQTDGLGSGTDTPEASETDGAENSEPRTFGRGIFGNRDDDTQATAPDDAPSFGSGDSEPDSFGSGEADEGASADSMNGARLARLIQKLDENAVVDTNRVVFKIAEREMMMVYDEGANRMRVISPIIPAAAVPSEVVERMLQANFDAVLDARYAIANDLVWSVFLHPLSSLSEDDFISALAQTVTAAETFGTTYTSGAVVFGGGDTSGIHEDLIEELKRAQKSQSDI